MSSVNVAPFMGGILMNNTAWRRIPERYRPQLLEVCRQLEREIEASITALEAEAISTMVRFGLVVNELTPQQQQVWFDEVARFESALTTGANPTFNREYYIRIRDILTEFRRNR
jgi:TRAP-type C4-dicarboxylate transport system substrate-binding protein